MTTDSDGEVSVSTSDADVANVSYNNGTITISCFTSGSPTITVTTAATDNYTMGTATISVTSTATLKTFNQATDAEIGAMVSAADEGYIDLYDDAGWRVGQEHQITLAAIGQTGTYDGVSWSVGESHTEQTATIVLMHKGTYSLVTPVKNKDKTLRSTCSFVAGLKNCLLVKGYMDSSATDSIIWDNCKRRSWCNSGFKQAIPQQIRNVCKQFYTITAKTRGGSENQISQDYFALPAAAEIFKGDSQYGQGGTVGIQTAYTNLAEFNALFRFTWYETSNNRIKTYGDSGSAAFYGDRSRPDGVDIRFCGTNSDGTPDSGAPATYSYGLSPFFCL